MVLQIVLTCPPWWPYSFTVVIACQLAEEPLLHLAKHLYAANIPLLSTCVNGLVGTVRLSVPEILGMSHP